MSLCLGTHCLRSDLPQDIRQMSLVADGTERTRLNDFVKYNCHGDHFLESGDG